MRFGVLTGGGDCPGLNAVIRAVVRKGEKEYGYEFIGFRDGWKGPLEGLTMPLNIAATRGILPRGGTILGSSRTNPFKIENGVERIKENLADRKSALSDNEDWSIRLFKTRFDVLADLFDIKWDFWDEDA